ncbi:MAG: hypothetical protein M1818_003594 [Claussenomyces sp. TS43310]|nr:MAG: hypothetical protein M1818_003594 [Claussenomyces sp. TS43310]
MPADPPSYDQDLLSRLNALKQSDISLDVKPSLGTPRKDIQTPEGDLSARLRSLRNGDATPSPRPSAAPEAASPRAHLQSATFSRSLSDHESGVSDVLIPSAPSKAWSIPKIDYGEGRRLAADARMLAKSMEGKGSEPRSRTGKETSGPVSSFNTESSDSGEDDHESGEEDESLEVQAILERLVDELQLEAQDETRNREGPSHQSEALLHAAATKPAIPRANSLASSTASSIDPGINPHDMPICRRKESLEFESDMAARMAAHRAASQKPLPVASPPSPDPSAFDTPRLPSVPTSSPKSPPLSTPQVIETWCEICLDNATIICRGCTDTLYCALCWRECHLGPDADRHSKRHEWIKFRPPK